MNIAAWSLGVAAMALPCVAFAQTAFRCGPDGRTYQQEPCSGGQAVNLADPRSEVQRAEAGRVAKDDGKLADRLARERRAQEAAAPSRAVGINARPVPAATAASAPSRGKPKKRAAQTADERNFVAVEPGSRARKAPSKKPAD
jgi:hypothetical protein